MTTTVSKTVIAGGGGDYSSWASWWADCPADISTATGTDQVYLGIGTGNFSAGASISGVTTGGGGKVKVQGSTTLVLQPELRFNTAAGCSLSITPDYTPGFVIGVQHCEISDIQISIVASAGGGVPIASTFGATAVVIVDRCILEGNRANAIDLYGSASLVRNTAHILRRSGYADAIAIIRNGSRAYNCTFVVPTGITAATYGIRGAYAAGTIQNCAIFGAATLTVGTAPTFITSYTDLGSPPSGVTQVSYNTTQFVATANGTHDFRLPDASALRDVGTTDTTNAATDLTGFPRATGAYDVGAWENTSAMLALTGMRATGRNGPVLWPAFGTFGETKITAYAPIADVIVLKVPNPPLPVHLDIIAMSTPDVNADPGGVIDLFPPEYAPAAGGTRALTGLTATMSQGVFLFDIVQALTGQAATATGGTLKPALDKAFTGQAATGTGGVLTPLDAVVLTGQAGTATGGVLTPNDAVVITGQAATATGGVLTPNIAVVLTGQAATGSIGSFSFAGNVDQALTGLAATATGGVLVPNDAVVLTGQAGTATGGTLTPHVDATQALTGLAATASGGLLSPALSIPFVGISASATGGTLTKTAENIVVLLGFAATATGGLLSLSFSSSVVLTGLRLNTFIGFLGIPSFKFGELYARAESYDLFAQYFRDELTYTNVPDETRYKSDDGSTSVRTKTEEDFVT